MGLSSVGQDPGRGRLHEIGFAKVDRREVGWVGFRERIREDSGGCCRGEESGGTDEVRIGCEDALASGDLRFEFRAGYQPDGFGDLPGFGEGHGPFAALGVGGKEDPAGIQFDREVREDVEAVDRDDGNAMGEVPALERGDGAADAGVASRTNSQRKAAHALGCEPRVAEGGGDQVRSRGGATGDDAAFCQDAAGVADRGRTAVAGEFKGEGRHG